MTDRSLNNSPRLGDRPDDVAARKELAQVARNLDLASPKPTPDPQIDLSTDMTPRIREVVSQIAAEHPEGQLNRFNLLDLRRRLASKMKEPAKPIQQDSVRSERLALVGISRRSFGQRVAAVATIALGTVSGFLSFGTSLAGAGEESVTPAVQANISPEELQKQVDKAISRGTTWLKKEAKKLIRQNEEEMSYEFPTTAALLAAALAKGGVSPKDRTFQKLIEIAETHLVYGGKTHGHATYGVSLLLIAYEYAYLPKDKVIDKTTIPTNVRLSISSFTKWLIKNLDSRGGWGYPLTSDVILPDISNTQYAANALSAAQSFGEKIPSQVFRNIADFALKQQATSGSDIILLPQTEEPLTGDNSTGKTVKALSFRYNIGQRGTLASTSAGIYILACALEGLQINAELAKSQTSSDSESEILDPEYRKKLEDAIYSGLAWLQENYSIEKNVGDANWHKYALVALDRAMVKVDRQYIGRNDWHRDLCLLLVELQEKNGSWPQGSSQEKLDRFHTDTFETAFSILALSESHKPLKRVLSVTTEETSTTEQASVK